MPGCGQVRSDCDLCIYCLVRAYDNDVLGMIDCHLKYYEVPCVPIAVPHDTTRDTKYWLLLYNVQCPAISLSSCRCQQSVLAGGKGEKMVVTEDGRQLLLFIEVIAIELVYTITAYLQRDPT